MAKVTLVLEDDYDTDELKITFESDPPFPLPQSDSEDEKQMPLFEDMTPAQTFGIMARLFLESEFRKIDEHAKQLAEETAETPAE
jgi:hypothetical protein